MVRKLNPALVVSIVALAFALTGTALAAFPASADLTSASTFSIPSLSASGIVTQDIPITLGDVNVTPIIGIQGGGGRIAWSWDPVNSTTIRITYRNVSGGISPAATATAQVLSRASD